MKDGAKLATNGMYCLTAIYAVYVMAHVCSGQPIPDGQLLLSMSVGIGSLAGGTAIAKAIKPS